MADRIVIPYVEPDCVIEHEGHTFESGGAVITDQFVFAYTSKDGKLTTWHGEVIGTWRITASWRTGPYGTMMHQIEARVNDIVYTGRGQGEGMLYHGRVKKTRRT